MLIEAPDTPFRARFVMKSAIWAGFKLHIAFFVFEARFLQLCCITNARNCCNGFIVAKSLVFIEEMKLSLVVCEI